MDLCLAYMPFGSLEPPPLGMALLVAAARRSGLSVRALYPSFDFASRMGILRYNAVSMGLGGFQIAEWIFSSAAFPDMPRDDDAYLRAYLDWERTRDADRFDLFFGDEEAFLGMCRTARELVPGFLQDLSGRILETGPRIVGCSSMYHQNCASLALLGMLKRNRPDLITMMGGANCEGPMGKALRRAFPDRVDVVFSGEADTLFAGLCRDLLDRGPEAVLGDPPEGVATGAGEPVTAMVEDLSDVPIPDYTEYLEARGDFLFAPAMGAIGLSFETSRGCWWGQRRPCSFCGVNGGRMLYRPKAPDRIRDELRVLASTTGCRTFLATDNILDLSLLRTALPDLVTRDGEDFDFFFEVSSNLREEDVRLLADSGVRRFQPGIESLHDGMLRLLRKAGSALGNVALLRYAREQGLKVTWMVLVDVPGEEDDWYGETADWLPLIGHLQPPHRVKPIRYDRFSPYHRDPAAWGIALMPLRWYRHLYPIPDADLQEFAYHFERVDPGAGTPPGPGRVRLEQALTDWMALHEVSREGGSPGLLAIREPDRTLVHDTRPCALEEHCVLTGLADRITRACDAPTPLRGLRERVGDPPDRWFREALDLLIRQGFLLRLGGRVLFLATRAPLRPYRHPPDYPFPRLRRMLQERGLSYWELLEQREDTLRAAAFSSIWT